jgi:hypothetical protein
MTGAQYGMTSAPFYSAAAGGWQEGGGEQARSSSEPFDQESQGQPSLFDPMAVGNQMLGQAEGQASAGLASIVDASAGGLEQMFAEANQVAAELGS